MTFQSLLSQAAGKTIVLLVDTKATYDAPRDLWQTHPGAPEHLALHGGLFDSLRLGRLLAVAFVGCCKDHTFNATIQPETLFTMNAGINNAMQSAYQTLRHFRSSPKTSR